MNIRSIIKSTVLILLVAVSVISCDFLGSGGGGSSINDLDPAEYNTILERSNINSYNGFTYEYWNQDEIGDAVMGLRDDGSFIVKWDGIFNMLGRNGVRPGQDVTEVSYTVENYNVTGGISYLCVYGWFYDGNYNNLVEYYIVENWKNWNPANGATWKEDVIVDGDTYKLYTSIRDQQPSINGTQTFTQYWSIREDLRTSGTIDVPAHFAAWENDAGLSIGSTMHEVSFCVEGFGLDNTGVGQADVTQLSFSTQ